MPAQGAAGELAPDDEQAIQAEQVRICMGAMPKIALYGCLAITTVMGFMAFREQTLVRQPSILLWGCAMYVVHALALGSGRRFAAGPRHDIGFVLAHIRKHDVLSVAVGFLWGTSSWLIVRQEHVDISVAMEIIVGLVLMGFASTEGAYRRGILFFTAPLVGVFGAGLLWVGGALQQVLAVAYLILGVAVMDFARVQEASVRQSIRHGIEADRLRAIAESASRAKTRFLASASHDLRQPMHTLALFVEALCLRPLDSASHHMALQLRQASQVLGAQLDALLDISKLDAQVVAVHMADVHVPAMLSRLEAEFQPVAHQKGLALRTEVDDTVQVRSDALHLERVLRNLIDNAIKYTQQGEVVLRTVRDEAVHGERWAIEVQDTGCGMASADHTRIFEEFYQLDNPHRDRTLGLGLGLSIVRRLVELIDGRITVQSAPGQGACFRVSLPAAGGGAARPSAQGEQAAHMAQHGEPIASIGTQALRGRHVLVIDDEAAVRHGMGALLGELGCDVTLAASVSAVPLAMARPDIALVDFRLAHGEDGIAAVQALRQRWPGMPALLISGDVAPDRLRQAHEAQLTLLHKPVPMALLMRALLPLLPDAAAT